MAPRRDAATGAGDAFAAGFIAAEIEGAGEAEGLRRGIEAGSRAVTRLGGQPEPRGA
ncbi:PfkB family carbohydrate kinase [Sorangium cellulosum]|uniref:PfkB family carbohydrate kinase n=1 Tax=Sorangium cellulosum TaxID=56 RepID=UPI0012DB4328